MLLGPVDPHALRTDFLKVFREEISPAILKREIDAWQVQVLVGVTGAHRPAISQTARASTAILETGTGGIGN